MGRLVALLAGIVLSCCVSAVAANSVVDLTLDYTAVAGVNAWAHIYASGIDVPPSPWPDSDTRVSQDLVSHHNAGAQAGTTAFATLYAYSEYVQSEPEPPIMADFFSFESAVATAEAGATLSEMAILFDSTITEEYGSQYYQNYSPMGSSHAGGWTHMWGTIELGVDEAGGIPAGTPLSLQISADIIGGQSSPLWDWHVKVWRGKTLIATLEDDLVAANLEVLAGETLSFDVVHTPEPASLSLLVAGAAVTLRRRLRRCNILADRAA